MSNNGPFHAWYSHEMHMRSIANNPVPQRYLTGTSKGGAVVYRRATGEQVLVTSVASVNSNDPTGGMCWADMRYCGIVERYVADGNHMRPFMGQFWDNIDPRSAVIHNKEHEAEFIEGTTTTRPVNQTGVCTDCKGSGHYVGMHKVELCAKCHGSGEDQEDNYDEVPF